MRIFGYLMAALAACAPMQMAEATTINSLPTGTPVTIPVFFGNMTSDTRTIEPGITASPETAFLFGYTGDYHVPLNGMWSGSNSPMIALSAATGYFDIMFEVAVRGFLADMIWATITTPQNATMSVYNSSDELLETLVLETGRVNQVRPGFHGFFRQDGDIAKVRFSNEYIAVRSMSVSLMTAEVPESSTWALILMGFGMIGAGVRSPQRSSTTVIYA